LNNKTNLFHYSENKVNINAFADDYAFFIWGLIEFYEVSFKSKYLKMAIESTEKMIEDFWDNINGGFYFTSKNSDDLFFRNKLAYDNAIPSANSVMVLNFQKLYQITSNSEYLRKSENIIKSFSTILEKSPNAFSYMLIGLNHLISTSSEIVVIAKEYTSEIRNIFYQFYKKFLPNSVFLLNTLKDDDNKISEISDFVKEYKIINKKTTIYICEKNICQQPTNDINFALTGLNR
jgi:uncharacterized protein